MPLKAAVIGAGKMGSYHANIYQQLPDTELVGLAVNTRPSADQKNKEYQVPVFTDYQQLINQLHPDIVSIASPTNTHPEIARLCLQSGIHVLLEKPIALNLSEARKLADFYSQLKPTPLLMIGLIERFNPIITAAKKIITEQKLGKLKFYGAVRSGPRPPKPSSDVLLDLGIHDLDLFFHLTGEILPHIKTFAQKSPDSSLIDFVNLQAVTKSDLIFSLQTDWRRHTPQRETIIIGSAGELHLKFLPKQLTLFAPGSVPQDIEIDTRINQLEQEIKSFITAIQKKQPSPLSITGALPSMEIYQQVMENKP